MRLNVLQPRLHNPSSKAERAMQMQISLVLFCRMWGMYPGRWSQHVQLKNIEPRIKNLSQTLALPIFIPLPIIRSQLLTIMQSKKNPPNYLCIIIITTPSLRSALCPGNVFRPALMGRQTRWRMTPFLRKTLKKNPPWSNRKSFEFFSWLIMKDGRLILILVLNSRLHTVCTGDNIQRAQTVTSHLTLTTLIHTEKIPNI